MNPNIFLVEDDVDDQELLEDALRAINPHIVLTSFMYGKEFIDKLDNTAFEALPSLIILDYNLPEINGAGLLQHLRDESRYDHVNRVVWSTSDSEKFKKDCLALGAKDYLLKPSSLSGMEVLAEKFLRYCDPG